MRSHAHEAPSRAIAALRMAAGAVLALAALGVTWRSEGDAATAIGVVGAIGAVLVMPRPAGWRGVLAGVPLFVVGVAALTVLAALLIIGGALLGYDGVTVGSETFRSP